MPSRPSVRLAAALLGVVSVCGGCGGSDGPSDEERAEVVLALGFLAEDFGYTGAQVDCVRQGLEEETGDDLARWGATLRGIDTGEVAIADLDDDERQVLVEAISRCAVEQS